jgi:hypothetical protein
MRGERTKPARRWPVFLFWMLFAAGLAVHLLAPNLERKDNAFVIPLMHESGQSTLSPDLIVAKERRMQLIAALLAASGALGLGFCHRAVLFQRVHRLRGSGLSGQHTDMRGHTIREQSKRS